MRGCAEDVADSLPRQALASGGGDGFDELALASGAGDRRAFKEVLLDRALIPRLGLVVLEVLGELVAVVEEALARAEGQSLNETVKTALREAVERRRDDPEFKRRVRRIIEEDTELLERLAK